jgi:hypothetical protein
MACVTKSLIRIYNGATKRVATFGGLKSLRPAPFSYRSDTGESDMKKQKEPCLYDGCDNKGDDTRGYCGKHAQRIRRYGDPSYVTSDEERVKRQRESFLKNKSENKPTTYSKYYGKHEHRVIAENMIGRELLSDEVVHHIDCNKHNNDESNLMVMKRTEHSRLHAQMRKDAKKISN